ncbi:MAG: glycosyltransferase [Acidobacteria bacterium]|nr:glycosyltransferase [Acidobacteriota bacterium]
MLETVHRRSFAEIMADLATTQDEALMSGVPRIPALILSIRHSRPDLRAVFPLTSTEGRQGLIDWFKFAGPREYGIDEPTLAAVLAESKGSYDPAVPVSDLRKLPLEPGANLIGYAKAELGMGEQVRMSAMAIKESTPNFGVYNFAIGTPSRQQDGLVDGLMQTSHRYAANIFHVNADQMMTAFTNLGAACFGDHYNIGYWAWELSNCPDEWLPAIAVVDEIWAPSRFIQDAFSKSTKKPVVHMPLCVHPVIPRQYRKEEFGLDEKAFTFLFTFDSFSYYERKNPCGLITAFRRAFRKGDEPVQLVIKTMNANSQDVNWRKIESAIEGDPRIVALNRVMCREDALGLISACDCFVSLHRSEGFGFGPAQAMYHGRPAIVTGYSGNMDFCNASNSALVNYSLIPVIEGQYPAATGQQWADPDVDHAIWWMKRLASDSDLAARMGKSGQAHIRTHHSPKAIGDMFVGRLGKLGLI